MSSFVTYSRDEDVATIRMDDGKVNAVAPRMIAELNAALDRAERDRAVVLLTGKRGTFSAGYDLPTLRAGGLDALRMVRGGLALCYRLLGFPLPVVVACTGHAIGAGLFLALSGDFRYATAGSFKFSAPEVAMGLTIPRAAVELCRERIDAAHHTRALLLAETYTPERAKDAGMVDDVVAADELEAKSREHALRLTKLDFGAHTRTKQRVRADVLRKMREGLAEDTRDLMLVGAQRFVRAQLARRNGARGSAD